MTRVTAGEEVFGLLRLAGMDVALTLAALREVVPCPSELAGLPATGDGLLGAMHLRHLVLPVLDLRPVLGRPSAGLAGHGGGSDPVVVVVAHGGRLLGLLADEVVGVTRLAPDALLAMTATDTDLLFSHTFRHPGTGQVVSVLDAAAVLARPGVPAVAEVALAGVTAGPTLPSADSRTFTLLQCGPYRLALDVASVHTTLLSSSARPSVLDSELCRGVAAFADRDIAVIDPLALLGLAPLPADDTGAGVVLALGDGYVTLALSGLLDLAVIPATDILPVPQFAVPRPSFLAGIVELERFGACLVLDAAALLTSEELLSYASVNTFLEGADKAPATIEDQHGDTAAAAGGPAYLTYTAGAQLASPLGQISEILPFPTVTLPTEVGVELLGVIVHRRAAVPVVCLATVLGRTPTPVTATSCVLLVTVDGEHVAFAVDALHGIDPLTWADPEQQASRTPDRLELALEAARLVQVGDATRLLPDLDLHALARAVRRGATVADAPAQDVLAEDPLAQDEWLPEAVGAG